MHVDYRVIVPDVFHGRDVEVRLGQEPGHELSMDEYVDEGDVGKDTNGRNWRETADDEVVYVVPDFSRAAQEVGGLWARRIIRAWFWR